MAESKLVAQATRGASVEMISSSLNHYKLSIPSGKSDHYRVAQLSDYPQLKRSKFPHRPNISLSLSARISNRSIPGTWGFGLWNDPFGFSLGYGGTPFRLPSLPNAVWFFGASQENHLSFSDKPGNGFLAQSFHSPFFHVILFAAGIALPFSRILVRKIMSKVVRDTSYAVGIDPTEWHKYKIEWSAKRVLFEVDDAQVFESFIIPNPPLGLVIWIDNQYAKFTPEGKVGFGVLENTKSDWLEVKDLDIA